MSNGQCVCDVCGERIDFKVADYRIVGIQLNGFRDLGDPLPTNIYRHCDCMPGCHWRGEGVYAVKFDDAFSVPFTQNSL